MRASSLRSRRVLVGLVAPAALVILVVSLGVLQYRWVGQVSERERDQLRQSLDRRARAFADDFDREISRAYEIFSMEPRATRPGEMEPRTFRPGEDASAQIARGVAEWRAASRFPGLIGAEYFVESANDATPALHRFNRESGQLEPGEWPPALAPVRTRLGAVRTRAQFVSGKDTFAFSTSPVFPGVPAILIPQLQARAVPSDAAKPAPGAGATMQMVVTVRGEDNHVILELDRAYIESTVLPALATSHFPDGEGYRLAAFGPGPSQSQVFVRGVPDEAPIDAANADASVGFFALRMEMIHAGAATFQTIVERPLRVEGLVITGAPTGTIRSVAPLPPPPAAPVATREQRILVEQAAARTADVRLRQNAWTLLAQHPAGSLDAMVAQARRRNLLLSFGILTVLAASAGLIGVNARRAEKLASQQMEFVATVSHELRTPLAVIRSAAQNLSAGVVQQPDQAKQYGTLIETEGRRLTDMVEQVLEYAGLSDAKRRGIARPVDAARLVEDVAAVTASLPEAEGVELEISVEPQLPAVMADEDAVRRALHNLIGNALKYAADGRWIGVRAARGTGADAAFVLIAVTDRGRGIPAADLARLFEPFYRGRHAVEQQIRGNGLGLSLVKGIAEAAGGRVTAASTPGTGSTFTLYLPIASGAAESVRADRNSPSIADAARTGGRTA
jgi:signal transduction histidine kinase